MFCLDTTTTFGFKYIQTDLSEKKKQFHRRRCNSTISQQMAMQLYLKNLHSGSQTKNHGFWFNLNNIGIM